MNSRMMTRSGLLLLLVLVALTSGCFKKSDRPDRPGKDDRSTTTTHAPEVTEKPDEDERELKTVLYRLNALNNTHSTLTIKSNLNATLYDTLEKNDKHVHYRLIFGDENPYSYIRISTHEPDCVIIDTMTYVPSDGEFILATLNSEATYDVCPRRVEMKLKWELQVDLQSDPVSLPVAVDGEIHIKTVEKPLMDVMLDLQKERKFSFGVKSYGDLGYMMTSIDGVELPRNVGESYSSYSFYLMKKKIGSDELCGLNLGVSNYRVQHTDEIVITMKQWKNFKYTKCSKPISNKVSP